jgi:SlyX protein
LSWLSAGIGLEFARKEFADSLKEKTMEQRLDDMEMLIMHQGQVIEQLNEVVTGHQTCIDRLTRELSIIKEHIRGMSGSDNLLPSEEEPPPHY